MRLSGGASLSGWQFGQSEGPRREDASALFVLIGSHAAAFFFGLPAFRGR